MLAVKLKPGERVVINGAVLRNGNSRNMLYFANQAAVLRERDVMLPEEATRPVSRVYYVVQLMLLTPGEIAACRPEFEQLMAGLLRAIEAQRMRDALIDCVRWVGEQNYYKALAALRPVLDYEARLLGDGPAEFDDTAEPA